MHNDFILINKNILIKERKDFIITIHTITPVGKQYKDSAYVHAYEIQNTWGNKIKVIVTLFMTRYVQR